MILGVDLGKQCGWALTGGNRHGQQVPAGS